MGRTLRDLYPDIRERSEILNEIMDTPRLKETFESWDKEEQEYFLEFCSGARGVKMLHDGFFKEILNPDTKPHRMEELLSLILKQQVKIKKVLPNDVSRIGAESALLVMDIVVELEDGTIANVECQRIGYAYMGQRAACYSSDLLLRQYKRVRDEKKKKFSYKDIKRVYSIVFYESSPKEFKKYSKDMLHYFRQTSDTGMEMDLLQEYIFIPLDIANKIHQNKGVAESKLEAWFLFLSNDEPAVIDEIIKRYPEFREIYHEIYEVCKNTGKVMDMFSEELRILDRNTVELMVDEMKAELDQLSDEKEQILAENKQMAEEIETLKKLLAEATKDK